MQTSLPLWISLLALAIGPAVGGVVALLGAFGGPWLKARTEVDQWRRERRLDAYAELARTIHDLTEAIAQRRDAAEPEVESALQAVERAQYAVMRAAARVQLVGPPNVRNASVAVARYVTDATSTLRAYRPHGQPNPLPAISEGLNAKYDVYMSAARRDLGVD